MSSFEYVHHLRNKNINYKPSGSELLTLQKGGALIGYLDKRLSRLDWIQTNLRQKILEIDFFLIPKIQVIFTMKECKIPFSKFLFFNG